jgi:Uncharacterized protein conserved in bacteria (DUF2252)
VSRFVVAAVWLVVLSLVCGCRQLKAAPEAVAAASPELLDRLRAEPYDYFRFINYEWTSRVCEVFTGDLANQPIVQLHGDAHVEQYALMNDAWGLDDFDDSARGPALIDIVRFLGSIDLAARQRGWTRDRDQLFDRFLAGYRRGLSDPSYQPPQPDIVRRLREQAPPLTPEAFLASAETKTDPVSESAMKGIVAAMDVFTQTVQKQRPEVPDGYFHVTRAGWLRIGVGSAASTKILIRVRGPSNDPADDVLLEAKALRSLAGLGCLQMPSSSPTFRVIAGNQQIGRLKHAILLGAPELALPEEAAQGEHLRDWWIRSWDPSYREVNLDDLRSVEDLSAIVFDSGVQLGAGSVRGRTAPEQTILRQQSLEAINALEVDLRKEARNIVIELLRGWREFAGRSQSRQ